MIHCARPIELPTSSSNVATLPTASQDYVNVSGLSGKETGGTNGVTVVLRAGGSTGPVVATLVLAAGGVGNAPINHPVKCQCPLYAEIDGSGTIDAAVQIL